MEYAPIDPERWTEDKKCLDSLLGIHENAMKAGGFYSSAPRGIVEYSLIRVAC